MSENKYFNHQGNSPDENPLLEEALISAICKNSEGVPLSADEQLQYDRFIKDNKPKITLDFKLIEELNIGEKRALESLPLFRKRLSELREDDCRSEKYSTFSDFNENNERVE